MAQGLFIGNVPYIQIALAWGSFIKNYWFILDTGFTGDLQVPVLFARELALTPNSVVPITIANGETVQVPHALAIAALEGVVKYVQVGISNGSPVDCKHRTILLD